MSGRHIERAMGQVQRQLGRKDLTPEERRRLERELSELELDLIEDDAIGSMSFDMDQDW
jgi:hypothetical protein